MNLHLLYIPKNVTNATMANEATITHLCKKEKNLLGSVDVLFYNDIFQHFDF